MTTPANNELATYEPPKGAGRGVAALKELDFKQMMYVGDLMFNAAMFNDLKSAAQAQVKIMAGQELGLAPMQSMNAFHIIHGRVTMAANTMASKVLESGRYRYRAQEISDKICILEFSVLEGAKWVPLGLSSFTIEDAQKAGTQNIHKFPRNMLFARALSNGVKWYCPDVFTVPVYVEGEIEEGEPVVKTEAEEQAELEDASKRLNRRKKAAVAGQKGLKVAETTPEPESPETGADEPTDDAPQDGGPSDPTPTKNVDVTPDTNKKEPEIVDDTPPTGQVEGNPETYMNAAVPAAPIAEPQEVHTPEEKPDTSGPHTVDQRDDIIKLLDDLGITGEYDRKAVFTGITGLSTFKDLTKAKADFLIFDLQTSDAAKLRARFIDKSAADGS